MQPWAWTLILVILSIGGLVPGYSAFGSYVGNGDPSGPFIYTGFRPAFVMVKRTTGNSNWQIMDSTRSPMNPANIWIEPNEPTGEKTGNSFIQEDFLSNGFKTVGGASQQETSMEKLTFIAVGLRTPLEEITYHPLTHAKLCFI